MPGSLPPAPINEPPGSDAWKQWYLHLRELYNQPGAIPWDAVNKSGANISHIPIRHHNTLQNIQGGTTGEFYHITAAQHAILSVALAGIYTPTLTNVANVDSSTAYSCQYMRLGTVVIVSGKLDVDPTANTTLTRVGISLPISSNLGAPEHCAGVATQESSATANGVVLGDATNDRAELSFISTGTTNVTFYFVFQYRIL